MFIQSPRTGSTAIGLLLRERLNGQFIPEKDLLDEDGFFLLPRKHSTISQLIKFEKITEEEAKSFYKFTCVRNPFDSLVSLYIKKRVTYQPRLSDPNSFLFKIPGCVDDVKFCLNHTFDEWINKNYATPLFKRLLGLGRKSMFEKYTDGVDCVMKMEQLQSDFDKVLKTVGISEALEIPLHNETVGRESGHQKYFTSFSKTIVEYKFQPDLVRYNYTFGNL